MWHDSGTLMSILKSSMVQTNLMMGPRWWLWSRWLDGYECVGNIWGMTWWRIWWSDVVYGIVWQEKIYIVKDYTPKPGARTDGYGAACGWFLTFPCKCPKKWRISSYNTTKHEQNSSSLSPCLHFLSFWMILKLKLEVS